MLYELQAQQKNWKVKKHELSQIIRAIDAVKASLMNTEENQAVNYWYLPFSREKDNRQVEQITKLLVATA